MSAVKVTSAQVREALKLRYPPAQFALLWEVAPSTRGGTRYADAVAFGLWASHGHQLDGIEVKVSRADFLNELKQPEKSQPVFRFCDRWWLACPKDMVKPDELPPTWGMLELLDIGVLRVKVKAPRLEPEKFTTGFIASLMRRNAGRDEEMAEASINERVKASVSEIKRQLESTHAQKLGYDQQRLLEAESRYERIKTETGIDLGRYGADDQIIAAIKFHGALNGGQFGYHDKLGQLLGRLNDVSTTLTSLGIEATK